MTEIADRYRVRADRFDALVAGVRPDQWGNRSPCADWLARDVVRHVVDMHGVMLRPLDRSLTAAPPVGEDPLGAYRSARADVAGLLDDPATAGLRVDTPAGSMTVEDTVDQVVSDDIVIHAWDLARATGQDATLDPRDVALLWERISLVPAETLALWRDPEALGVEVLGLEVPVPADAPLDQRLLGLYGRDPG